MELHQRIRMLDEVGGRGKEKGHGASQEGHGNARNSREKGSD